VLRDPDATQAEQRTDDDPAALIFPSGRGTHLDRSLVSRKWHPATLKRAGLRRSVRLHDLRHSAAAAWLASGLPMMYVQRQLGHADVGTTIRNYAHRAELPPRRRRASGSRDFRPPGIHRVAVCPLCAHRPGSVPVGERPATL